MKNKLKKIIVSLLVFTMLFANMININNSYAVSNPNLIKSRGLVFNTGIFSDQIRLLKDFFRVRGGSSNVPWGYGYDNQTKELVRSYQKSVGLSADGIAGNATINKINNEIKRNNYKIGARQPSTNIRGDMIIINKSSNTLYHMKNGRPYRAYPVATGKSQDFTPDGKHKVVVKFKNPYWGGAGVSKPIPGGAPNNPLGKRWIGLSYGGGGKYGIHGNASPLSIGKYASLGCVRMHNSDVEKLFDEISIGTPVWIGHESLLKSYGVQFNHKYVVTASPKPKPSGPRPVNDMSVVLDGKKLNIKDPVYAKNGTSYHPLKEIFQDHLGADVKWINSTRTVQVKLNGKKVDFPLDKNSYYIDGKVKYLPSGQKTFAKNGKSYIPLRHALEALGYDVGWNNASRSIIVKSPIEKPIEKPLASPKVILNGKELKLKDPVIIEAGTSYYPFREILEEHLGANVEWIQETQTAVGELDGRKVEFSVNKNSYYVDGKLMNLPKGQNAFLRNQKTYIPLRYLMEGLGFDVDWDDSTRTIIVTKKIEEKPEENPEEKPEEDLEEKPEENLEEKPEEDLKEKPEENLEEKSEKDKNDYETEIKDQVNIDDIDIDIIIKS